MRWMKRNIGTQRYYVNSIRTKKKFLLFPKCLPLEEYDYSDIEPKQWRWFERVEIKQRCTHAWRLKLFGWVSKWKNVAWEEELEDEVDEELDEELEDDEENYRLRVGLSE